MGSKFESFQIVMNETVSCSWYRCLNFLDVFPIYFAPHSHLNWYMLEQESLSIFLFLFFNLFYMKLVVLN